MNIYKAKRQESNVVIQGQYYTWGNIHWILEVNNGGNASYPIDPSTLEIVKLDLNEHQKAWLKNVAYRDLIAFREGFNFLHDESVKIFFDSENYDSQVADWAIELINKLLSKIKEARELLKGI